MNQLFASSLVLTVCLIVFGILLLPLIFYILTLQKALNRCVPSSRTLSPGTLWLLVIPIVNLIWHFFVVLGMSRSLSNEYQRRGLPAPDPNPGQSVGLAMCICGICSIIPVLGVLLALAHLALWIVYWVKIADYSNQISEIPTVQPTPSLN